MRERSRKGLERASQRQFLELFEHAQDGVLGLGRVVLTVERAQALEPGLLLWAAQQNGGLRIHVLHCGIAPLEIPVEPEVVTAAVHALALVRDVLQLVRAQRQVV